MRLSDRAPGLVLGDGVVLPDSVTIGTIAAMSYSLTPNSATNSSRPSARSM